jgi:hypothetical protein
MSVLFKPPPKDRRGGQRLRTVVVLYAVIAYLCLAISVYLGDMTFVALTGIIALMATLALARVWAGN